MDQPRHQYIVGVNQHETRDHQAGTQEVEECEGLALDDDVSDHCEWDAEAQSDSGDQGRGEEY